MNHHITHKGEHGTFKSYLSGFLACVFLTLIAYFFVEHSSFSKKALFPIVLGLGIVQAMTQFVLFLHVGDEPKPRINFMTFLFMLWIVVILVVGSLWIMANLDYRMMEGM